MQITANRSGDTLELRLAGRLDTTTAAALEAALALDGVTALTINLDQCPYVSSAGLREILRAQKQMTARRGSLVVTDVHREVREVLDMTGFSKFLTIRNKVRQISIEGLEFISAGACGACYRLDHETVVKLYNEGTPPEVAEQEKEFARAAFVLGIPTAISFDIVACGNRTGVIYEMLDAQTLSSLIRNHLDQVDDHAKTLADVARVIHETPSDPAVFPDLKAKFRGCIDQMDFFLSADEIALLHAKLDTIPDAQTCVHFDLHTSNIMVRGGEPIIIDMGDFSRGSYLFDIGLLYGFYGLPELKVCERVLKIPAEHGAVLWQQFAHHYFAHKPPAERAFFEQNRYFLAALRLIYISVFLPTLRDEMAALIKDVFLPEIRKG